MASVCTVTFNIWRRARSVMNKVFCSRAWCLEPGVWTNNFFFLFWIVGGKKSRGRGLCRWNVQHRVKHCFPTSRRYTLKGLSAGVRHWPSPYLVWLGSLADCSAWHSLVARGTWEDGFCCNRLLLESAGRRQTVFSVVVSIHILT